MEVIAYLLIRISLAYLFLMPIPDLMKDWKATKDMVGILSLSGRNFIAIMMILSMILSSLSVLFGYYAEIGGLMIAIYCAIGIYIHQNFAKMALSMTLRDKVSYKDAETFQSLSTLAAVGHGSSAMKNIVICALGLFLCLQGSGPFSLTEKLWH